MTLKKSPGIITLISDKEIANSGARDLMEVLEMVPGLIFHSDVQGVVSIGVRGLWAEEGKTLVLIDGQEMNELLYSTIQFGNHFPVDQIKRIEILRGPGSAIYGGMAELAVINIITKSAEDLQGIASKFYFGLIPGDIPDFTHRNFSFSYGQKFDDLSLVAHAVFGKGNRSNRTFTDFYGNSFDMTANAEINPSFLNIGLGYKDFSAKFIMDLFRQTSADLYSENSPASIGPAPILFDGYYGQLKYDFRPTDNITISPRINYKRQLPWNSTTDVSKKLEENGNFAGVYQNKMVERYSADISGNFDFTENINLIGGTEFYYDIARANEKISADFGPKKDQESISYNNIAVFAQGLYKTDYFSFTLGSRFENHSAYGISFVPRVAATAALGDFHSKLIYSKAFRAPGIQNINDFQPKFSNNPSIKPENTTVIELETGYDFTRKLSLSANIFDITIQDPIIYYSDDEDFDAYDNFARTGSRGVELELNYKDKKWGYGNMAYSLSMANDNQVNIYDVPGHKEVLLGFPLHKFSLKSSINITENFSINPSIIFWGSRFGYDTLQDEKPVIKEFSPELMVNLNLLYHDLFLKGLDLSLGGYNLLNQTYYFIQPYNALHAAIPGPGTEFSLNLGYSFPLGVSK
jgi:outer membrane receptor for ferrienterochelin and colicin